MITSYQIGTVNAGEAAALIRPKYPQPGAAGFLYCHGAGGSAHSALSDYGEQGRLSARLTRAGLIGLSTDLGGAQTWANDLAMARMTAAHTYLTGSMGASPAAPVTLISGSMGAANAFAWAAAHPALVAGIVAMLPVASIDDIHANNRGGLTSTIDGAHPGGWTPAIAATRDGLALAQSGALSGIPILAYYGTTDTLCIPSVALALAQASGAVLRPVPHGHSAAGLAACDPDEIVEFIARLDAREG